jgi:hypothetical protein
MAHGLTGTGSPRSRSAYAGSCHCGNITLTLASEKQPSELGLRADMCSFCAKHHAIYTSDPQGELRIVVRDEARLERYRFGTKTADFLLCRACGVLVAAHVPELAVAVVNVHALDLRAEFLAMEVRTSALDGETVGERALRRRAKWTPASVVVAATTA